MKSAGNSGEHGHGSGMLNKYGGPDDDEGGKTTNSTGKTQLGKTGRICHEGSEKNYGTQIFTESRG